MKYSQPTTGACAAGPRTDRLRGALSLPHSRAGGAALRLPRAGAVPALKSTSHPWVPNRCGLQGGPSLVGTTGTSARHARLRSLEGLARGGGPRSAQDLGSRPTPDGVAGVTRRCLDTQAPRGALGERSARGAGGRAPREQPGLASERAAAWCSRFFVVQGVARGGSQHEGRRRVYKHGVFTCIYL